MYKLVVNKNRTLILLALASGLAAVFYFPGQYPEKIVEIPLLALFVGQLGLSMFASLLFYENASPNQVLKLTATMVGFAMVIGAFGNWVAQLTLMLPDSLVLVSWVQLIIMNLASLISTLTLFRLTISQQTTDLSNLPADNKERHGSEPEGDKEGSADDFSPPLEAQCQATEPTGALPSVKEILESLDVSRIMRLERSLHPPEPPSLETLFKEESQAAQAAEVHPDSCQILDDDLLDQAFNQLVSPEAQRGVSAETLSLIKQTKHSAEHVSMDESKQEEKTIKDFGRLSSKASAKSDAETLGSMKSIGKMLIDTHAIENIIKHGENTPTSTARVVTSKHGEELMSLLASIDSYPGVKGSLIVGKDGLVISSTLDLGEDKDLLGAMSMSIQSNTTIASQKLKLGQLESIVLKSNYGLLVLQNLKDSTLAVCCQSLEPESINGLLNAIKTALDSQSDKSGSTAPSQAEAPEEHAYAEANYETDQVSSTKHAPVAADLVRDLIESLSSGDKTETSISEFGRLSSSSSAPADSAGSMKTIGKMLLDVQAVSNIIKTAPKQDIGLTTAKVISAARGEGIRALLKNIDTYPGVIGSLIVGGDGLVIASTVDPTADKDMLGAMANSVHSHTGMATQKLKLGKLNQAILHSSDKTTVLTKVDVGILVVLANWEAKEKLDGLLTAIEETITGKK